MIQDAAALVRGVDYIHLNPVRAWICAAAEPAKFPWGSLARFVHGPRPAWLSAREWLAQLQIRDSTAGWVRYVEWLHCIASHPSDPQRTEFEDGSRGKPIGTDAWKRALARDHRLRALEQDLPHEEVLPLKQARWTAAFEQALDHHRIKVTEIVASQRAPRWKVKVACLIRQTSGAPWRWIAEQLRLPHPASLRAAVCWLGRR